MNVDLSRRHVVAGAGAAAGVLALAACGSSTSVDYSDDSNSDDSSSGGQSSAETTTEQAPAGLAKTADVPVGGGVILDGVVITQETAGDFKAFSAVCTHQGCNVESVSGGVIICPCHNSHFNLDGTVAQGPASRPLSSVGIKVEGDSIVEG